MLAVVCRGMQQFPTTLEIMERIRAIKLCKITKLDSLMHVRGLKKFWKSCANGSNIVAPRFGDHGTKKMLGVVGSK